jgi:uncharacterized FlaG/YvyC family protein
MKIQSWTGNLGYFGSVREKQEGAQGGYSRSSGDQKKKESEHQQEMSDSNFEDENPSQEKMSEAVKEFSSDSQAQLNGLSASLEGSGPGLKVILKDGTGQVVRQFTGPEFVQLRNSVPKEGHSNGKILDRKL